MQAKKYLQKSTTSWNATVIIDA